MKKLVSALGILALGGLFAVGCSYQTQIDQATSQAEASAQSASTATTNAQNSANQAAQSAKSAQEAAGWRRGLSQARKRRCGSPRSGIRVLRYEVTISAWRKRSPILFRHFLKLSIAIGERATQRCAFGVALWVGERRARGERHRARGRRSRYAARGRERLPRSVPEPRRLVRRSCCDCPASRGRPRHTFRSVQVRRPCPRWHRRRCRHHRPGRASGRPGGSRRGR